VAAFIETRRRVRAIDHRRAAGGTIDTRAIRCPRCGREAAFEPPSRWVRGEEGRAAAADPSLTGVWYCGAYVVMRYPELVPWRDVARSRRDARPLGVCRCGGCGYLNRHLLDWPAEAFYTVSLRGRTLWMQSREHVAALRAYVAAGDRRSVPGSAWLSRVPGEFLAARNRGVLVKKLDALLADGPEPRAVPPRPHPSSPPVIR
jgi:hypothetical protein